MGEFKKKDQERIHLQAYEAEKAPAQKRSLPSDILQELIKKTGFAQDVAEELLAQGITSWQELLPQADDALAQEKWEVLERFFHNIKGSAANLRAQKLSELATEGILQATEGNKENVGKLIAEIRTMVKDMGDEEH